jgi:hypothetical protein
MIDSTKSTGTFASEPDTRSPEYNDNLNAGTAPIGSKDNMRGSAADKASGIVDGGSSTSIDETADLIAADKVNGTAVYGADSERLGTIDSIMIGKRSGKVAYVVMSFGGFLGIGERYHPLPWNVLRYDEAKGGYSVGNSAEALRSAPHYSRDELDRREYGRAVDEYYGGATTTGAPP